MVLQLAQHIQGFLHTHNVPNLSFYEQMLSNKKKEKERLQIEEFHKREAERAEDKEMEKHIVSIT